MAICDLCGENNPCRDVCQGEWVRVHFERCLNKVCKRCDDAIEKEKLLNREKIKNEEQRDWIKKREKIELTKMIEAYEL